MKKLITVKSNLENYDISLDMERLDELPIRECDCLLEHLRDNIIAYKCLRHAREAIEAAEQKMTLAKTDLKGAYFSHGFDDDIPF